MMLQNLLVERFGLKLHRERKEVPTYALVVGKSGHKMKENHEPELADEPDVASQPRGADGFRVMPPGYTGMLMAVPNPGRNIAFKFLRYSLPKFADFLSGSVDRPVADRTGLKGNYDFTLELAAEAETEAWQILLRAIPSQLGLKLVPDTGMIEMLVIDYAERKPLAN